MLRLSWYKERILYESVFDDSVLYIYFELISCHYRSIAVEYGT